MLSADAGVTALVPATRIYPDGEEQNVSLPKIKHGVVSDRSVYTHTGRATLRNADFYQVAIYATTMQQVRQIAEAVITALSGCHEVGSPADGLTGFHTHTTKLPYDMEVRCCGLALDFDIWYGN